MNNYDVNRLYQDMELYLIKSMKRNLSNHLKEEQKYGFSWKQWQAEKLKEIKRYQKENAAIIGNTGNQITKEVSRQLKSQFREGNKNAQKQFKLAQNKGYKYDGKMNQSFFKINDRKVNNLIKSVNNDLDVANIATLRMANDQYREIIHKAVMFASNGVMTEKQAIDMATKDFLSKGLNSIEYSNGARVNIANYSKMAVRTASQRAYLQGEGEFRKKIGNPFVKISKHGTSCKLCQVWEGRILIDDVYSGGSSKDGPYGLLSEAMKQGLYHPNCKHGLNTYYAELEDIHFDESGPTLETLSNYQEDLNYCNLMIQKYTRLAAGSLDKNNIMYYNNKKEEWNNRIKTIDIIDRTKKVVSTTFIERTKGVKIKRFEEKYSYIKIDNNQIYLGKNADEYALIHELGHKLQSNFTKEEKLVYNEIIKNKFSKYSKRNFKIINSKTGKYWVLKDSSDFVSTYQTRVYNGFGNFILNKVNVKYCGEYFTEGVKYYYKNPSLLRKKDFKLYNFIESVVNDK